MKDLAN